MAAVNYLAKYGPEDNAEWRKVTLALSTAQTDAEIATAIKEITSMVEKNATISAKLKPADLLALQRDKKKGLGGESWSTTASEAYQQLKSYVDSVHPVICGIDIGSSEIVAAVCDGRNGKSARIVRNDLANWATPTLVSFHGQKREVGEHALDKLRLQPELVISDMVRLQGVSREEYEKLTQGNHTFSLIDDPSEDRPWISVTYKDAPLQISPEHALAMVLKRVSEFVQEAEGSLPTQLAIAVPPYFNSSQRAAVVDACRIAGLAGEAGKAGAVQVRLVDAVQAAAAQWACKHQSTLPADDENPAHVMIVNMGSQITSIGVFAATKNSLRCLATESSNSVGASNIDHTLAQLCQDACKEKKVNVAPKSRLYTRVLRECEKAKKVLSTVAVASIDIEHVTTTDGAETDVHFKVNRREVDSLCEELKENFKKLLLDALYSSKTDPSTSRGVELIGGGTRIPWVKEVVVEVAGDRLNYTLDGSHAVATGAAIIASQYSEGIGVRKAISTTSLTSAFVTGNSTAVPQPEDIVMQDAQETPEGERVESNESQQNGEEAAPKKASEGFSFDYILASSEELQSASTLSQEAFEKALSLEAELQEQERLVREATAARNHLEQYVYEIRNALSGKHKAQMNAEIVTPLLDQAEDWMWERDDRTVDEYKTKFSELESSIKENCPEYFQAVEDERLRIEADLAKEAAEAAAQAAAEGGDDEDHDRRKLKKADRMRLVVKNKEEGNELFKGNNIEMAATRYIKALNHCTKFFDLTPEGRKEVDTVKLSIYLNLSQCYLKLEKWQQAVENCKSALQVDTESVKALYRKAVALEALKLYDQAEADINKAASLAPSDAAVQRLQKRLEAIRAKQKAKEKKMAQKMFGGA